MYLQAIKIETWGGEGFSVPVLMNIDMPMNLKCPIIYKMWLYDEIQGRCQTKSPHVCVINIDDITVFVFICK